MRRFAAGPSSPDGVDDGFCHYTVKWSDDTFGGAAGVGEVHDLFGATPAVEVALWSYLVGIDLVRTYTADERPEDDVARWAFADPRAFLVTERYDEQWLRLLDVPVALAARSAKLFGVHLNDGYGKRDDGLMVGTVHPVQTLELLYTLDRIGYDRPIYFDTFPDTTGLDPVAECSANIATVETLRAVVRKLRGDNRLATAIAAQDAVTSNNIVRAALYATPA
jgi:hypothetical protein